MEILINGKPMNQNLTTTEFIKMGRDERDAHFWGGIQTMECSMTDRANNTERWSRRNTSFSLFAAGFATGLIPLVDYLSQKISFGELAIRATPAAVPIAIILWINLRVWYGEKNRLRTEEDSKSAISMAHGNGN